MNYNWKEFDAKYRDIIGSIARSNPVGENDQADLGVARTMLVYMAEHGEGEKYAGVPDGFDWETCRADVAAVRAQR